MPPGSPDGAARNFWLPRLPEPVPADRQERRVGGRRFSDRRGAGGRGPGPGGRGMMIMVAFALLAWLSWFGLAGNVPTATGASRGVGKVTRG